MYYTFNSMKASNGITLKVIKTSPNNIVLTYLGGKSVPSSGKLGMNGGFFQDLPLPAGQTKPNVYSIAVNDNVPINGGFGDYGSGGTQDVTRGTLVWDKTKRTFWVQPTKVGDEATLWVNYGDKYWAQGGISMNLQDDANWRSIAISEGMPVIDETWPNRSGLLWNSGNNVFLVVSETKCSGTAFRSACKEIESGMVNGIFLDGADAAQMNVPGTYSTSWTRQLAAMVEVVHNVDIDGTSPAVELSPGLPGYLNGETSKVFKITGAGYATIRTEFYQQQCDTYLELYYDENLTSKVTEDDDQGGNQYSLITGWYLNWGQTYYLKVRNFHDGSPTYAKVSVQF
ncbi:hypothetical protein D3C73_514280 [compost metagenome]